MGFSVVLLFPAIMSAVLDNVVLPTAEVVTKTKTKKPVLPAKLGKFLVFGYAFVTDLQASGVLTDDLVERAYDLLRVFASVEEQTLYYQNFLDQSTATAKVLRKFVANRSKPPKPLKNKKNTGADAGTSRASKPRAKKSVRVVSDAANDLIGQIVAAANSDLPLDTTVVTDGTAEVKAKKPRAPRKPKTTAAAADPIPIALPDTAIDPVVSNDVVTEPALDATTAEVKAKKPRAPRKPKTAAVDTTAATAVDTVVPDVKTKKPRAPRKPKTVDTPPTEPLVLDTVVVPLAVEPPSVRPSTPLLPDDEDDDDAINATEFIYDGTQYLIDDQYNVYFNDTHELAGRYDPISKTLLASS